MEKIERHIVIQADTLEKVKKAYVNYKKSPKERLTAGYVKGRIDTLELYWKEFQVVHEKLILSVPMEQRQATNYFADNTFEAFEEEYYTYKGEMMSKLESIVPTKTMVHVTAESGQSHVLRALVDQGSEESFVTARAVELLGLKKTKISGVISGIEECETTFKHRHITSLHVTTQIEEDNKKGFWEVEPELYQKHSMWTKEEEKCEEIYQQTTTRDETGRYVVQLPLKTNFEDTVRSWGNTKRQAVMRLEQLERKFARNEHLKAEYTRVIHECLQLGHMKKVDTEDKGNAVYLEHCAVIREGKETSKLRLDFDSSANGPNGCSVNSSMMVGPTIQPDLRSLVFRWRTHKICVVGDIIKMYRQVRMNDKHTDLERIVWRDNTSEKIDSHKLLTVTFGTAAAPHLDVRTLQRLADDEQDNYPRGAAVATNSFYMDSLMTGHEDLDEMKATCKEINELKAGGFEMQKWSSNSEELLKDLIDGTKTPEPVKDKKEIKLDKIIKILGLTWDRKDDTFHVPVNLPASRVTKRVILSEHDIVHVTRLASKTKVAPLKQLTVPKLELCAAVLLAKLLHEISGLFNIPMHRIYAWTDPMVVFAWLQSPSSRWQVFVGNRFSEIIQHIDNDRWRQVSSGDNPADLASRGIKASELTNNGLWWSGPVWLKETNTEVLRATTIPTTDLESKKSFHTSVQDAPIWERFSSIVRMKRVIAQCKRFLDYKNKKDDILSADEFNEVKNCCVRYYQELVYSEEFEDLKKKGKVRNKSSLIILTPYVDEDDKWYNVVKSPCIRDVVIMKEQDLPPAKWLLGKITPLHAGPDNLVRVVKVRYKGDHILKKTVAV
ncbi:uncharacterized protein LOC134666932 [Cydia fagiglandana]|uniref:uncharacterized protein LOC134666932 n=1 Tax=Cydia fagiglandana TaxID=1458189 RepID=UPI002FEE52BE